MLRVGLTGGIACGKSVVRRRLEERGVRTLDADAVVHRLLGPGTEVSAEIGRSFGAGVLSADGSVDRKALGALVFGDASARERLEKIVHPHVYQAIGAFLAGAERDGEPLAVVDAALMVETGSFREYDRVVVVHCRPEQQLERLSARDGISAEEAAKRIAAQMPVAEKMTYGDVLVDTSGTMAETLARTDDALDALRREADGRRSRRGPR